uniref:Uncharacterized protein n=1 Tax=Graphocephala atropunctata TaxID=36148 RepID=A0A1B6KY67_9HEMI
MFTFTPCTLLVVAVILENAGLFLAYSLFGNSFVANGVYAGYNNVNNPSYTMNSNSYWTDGHCVQDIRVGGRGVSDSFRLPCDRISNMNTLTTDTAMMVGDPSSFCLFSDTPSTLVVVEDGECTMRTYTTNTDGETTIDSYPLTDDECSKVLQRIADEQEKNQKYWKDWSENFFNTLRRAFPPGFPFNR